LRRRARSMRLIGLAVLTAAIGIAIDAGSVAVILR
jgi:hypothetical protein